MQAKSRITLVAAMLAASLAIPTVCAFACDVVPRSVKAERDKAKRDAASREADASRVADWLAQRILHDLAENDTEMVDISAEEVRAATGVDATKLDLERLREQVAAKMLAIGPSESRSVVPAPRRAPAAKAALTPPAAKKASTVHGAKKAAPTRTAKAAKPDASRGGASVRRATEDSSCGRTLMRH
jgi:hypothetical protein